MYRKINSLFIRLKNFIRIHFSRSYTASLEGAYDFTVRNFGHQFKLPDVRFPVDKANTTLIRLSHLVIAGLTGIRYGLPREGSSSPNLGIGYLPCPIMSGSLSENI